ncbi:unnamed protein product [Orchesella dallaii]|uniref:VWFA domain-containing protein n=1 Tax=Orchesella dallaii TaxID=48710 RepID=A0ABP1R408_9HEXA
MNCTYVKLQLVFVVDVSSQSVIQYFQRVSSDITIWLQKIFRDPEFGVTTFADWDSAAWGSISHNDAEGCFKITQQLTTDDVKISNAARRLKHLASDSTENGDTALAWTAASKNVGWTRNAMLSDGRQVVRLMVLFENQFVNPEGMLKYPRDRQPSKGDGTDSCVKTLPVTRNVFENVLTRDGMSVMGIFTLDEDSGVIDKWNDLFDSVDQLPYMSLSDSTPTPDIVNYIKSLVAAQNLDCM